MLHNESLNHKYAVELYTHRIWSYAEDNYVHRIVRVNIKNNNQSPAQIKQIDGG